MTDEEAIYGCMFLIIKALAAWKVFDIVWWLFDHVSVTVN